MKATRLDGVNDELLEHDEYLFQIQVSQYIRYLFKGFETTGQQ